LGKSYFERSLEWGARDSARRAKERARRERQEREREERKTERRRQTGPQYVQYRDDDVTVKVQSAYSVDLGVPTTDIQIYPRDGSGDHVHQVLDPYGEVIFDEWRERH
jgi:hypothetical protein